MDPFLLKDLDFHLEVFLVANQHISHTCCSLHEEFLCCCDRARHAIKEFSNQGDDGKVSHFFLVAGDALCDLQWCSDKIKHQRGLGKMSADFRHQCINEYNSKDRIETQRRNIEESLFDLWSRLWLTRSSTKTFIKHKASSVYRWDARNGPCGSAHLPPGLNLDDLGEIKPLSPLGEGSQGMVYKAMWSSSSGTSEGGVYAPWHELVAVKEVSCETRSEGLVALEPAVVRSSGDSVSRSNLYCELDVLKTLNHPNIVELKGYTRNVKAEGKYGLVMELMKCSLGDLIESDKLSDLAKVDTLLQVARGMHYLHMVGIMHRDLKPANILIRELNYLPLNARSLSYVVAKLADFGLSKGLSKEKDLVVDQAGLHTYKQGTSFYMAPEVRKSCKYASGQSRYAMLADVFSFGTTCFNVLTGERTPFAQKGHPLKSEEFYRRIKEGNLDELLDNIEYGQSNIEYGRFEMIALVRQCWCLDPSKRPNFLQICQILEDEKRQILCPTSWMSPSMLINKVGPSVYNPFKEICQILEQDKRRLMDRNKSVGAILWMKLKQAFYPPFEHLMQCCKS